MEFRIPVTSDKCVTLLTVSNVTQFTEFGLFCINIGGDGYSTITTGKL